MVKKVKPKKPKTKDKAVASKSLIDDTVPEEASDKASTVPVEEGSDISATLEFPVEGSVPPPVKPLLDRVDVRQEIEAPPAEIQVSTSLEKSATPDAEVGILAVLGVQSDEDARVGGENLQKYLDYLKQNLDLPFIATGMKPFGWEKQYVWGLWNRLDAYEKSKADYPSYTDTFQIIALSDFDEIDGIFVIAVRNSDNREFVLPLIQLKVVDADTKSGQLISDYVSWFEAYR